jgi:hypothetical protein
VNVWTRAALGLIAVVVVTKLLMVLATGVQAAVQSVGVVLR